LTPATHRIAVRAIDQAGNVSGSTSFQWLVDTAPPEITITGTPPASTTTTDATFTFTGRDDRTWTPDVRFECALDDSAPTPCASPHTVVGVHPGSHTLGVSAVDQAGNRSPAAAVAWHIELVVTSALPAAAAAGHAYEHRFTTNAPADAPTTTWSLTAGVLPWGVRLTDGALLGTPQQAGTFGPITVVGTSALGTVSQTFSLEVAATDSIIGTVTDAHTGLAAPGVKVRAYNADGTVVARADTGADGAYHLGYLRPGTYRVEFVDLNGRYTAELWTGATTLDDAQPITVADATVQRADARLTPLPRILGRVTDAISGAALPDVWVSLIDRSGATVSFRVTDAAGQYDFPNLTAGSYRLRFATLAGTHVAEHWVDAATLAEATPIALAEHGWFTADAALVRAGAISGVVTDSQHGRPIGGVRVALLDAHHAGVALTVTDAAGYYTFSSVVPGRYTMSFGDSTGAYFTEYWNDAQALAGATMVSVVGGGTVTASAALDPVTTIAGRVTSGRDGSGIAGATVTLYDGAGRAVLLTRADASGSFSFARLRPGSYRLKASDPTLAHLVTFWLDATTLEAATPLVAAGGRIDASVRLQPT
jgi:protocatechuate 3,4-dioxygenase beta subunit